MTTTDEFMGYADQHRRAGVPDDVRHVSTHEGWAAKHAAWKAEEAWRETREERRALRLIAAAGLALGLAIAGGMGAAWQIDRVLADWHYGLGQPAPAEPEAGPEGPDHPSAYTPEVRA